MKIVGINGSPRKNQNTHYALSYALDLFERKSWKTENIIIAGKNINGCMACYKCNKTGICIQNDDMKKIIKSIESCDCLLLASPVYLGSVTGQLKILMDRTLPLRMNNTFKMSGKIGAGIALGAFRNGGQELTLQCMHTFFLQQNMIVINDGPPHCHSGATIVGDTKKDILGLETIECLVNNINKKNNLINKII